MRGQALASGLWLDVASENAVRETERRTCRVSAGQGLGTAQGKALRAHGQAPSQGYSQLYTQDSTRAGCVQGKHLLSHPESSARTRDRGVTTNAGPIWGVGEDKPAH